MQLLATDAMMDALPTIAFAEEFHDFGEVQEGEVVEHTFVLLMKVKVLYHLQCTRVLWLYSTRLATSTYRTWSERSD
jgi:hypothetical protein